MKISTLKKKFQNEWILAEVLKEDKYNRVQEAKPIFHAKDRTGVYEALAKVKHKTHLATIYTGKLPPKGMVYAFYAKSKV